MQFIATTSSTYLVATGTRTPEMVPTPSASSNQLLLEYILAALVAVFVASSILLGIRSVHIYLIAHIDDNFLQPLCSYLQAEK